MVYSSRSEKVFNDVMCKLMSLGLICRELEAKDSSDSDLNEICEEIENLNKKLNKIADKWQKKYGCKIGFE